MMAHNHSTSSLNDKSTFYPINFSRYRYRKNKFIKGWLSNLDGVHPDLKDVENDEEDHSDSDVTVPFAHHPLTEKERSELKIARETNPNPVFWGPNYEKLHPHRFPQPTTIAKQNKKKKGENNNGKSLDNRSRIMKRTSDSLVVALQIPKLPYCADRLFRDTSRFEGKGVKRQAEATSSCRPRKKVRGNNDLGLASEE